MILLGDCLEKLKELEENSVDAVVTDPPYGWRFMGKAWDGADIEKKANDRALSQKTEVYYDPRPGREKFYTKKINRASESAGTYDISLKGNEAFCKWTEEYARELLRVLKPGGHAFIFCGPRTYHAMAFGVERAGFEIRDQLQWIFGSGFPKSHNGDHGGTALKPANEPIVLARKPLSEKTVAANFLKWGVGGLNIDESRIAGAKPEMVRTQTKVSENAMSGESTGATSTGNISTQGRWPANVLLDETAAAMLDEQSGILKSGTHIPKAKEASIQPGGWKTAARHQGGEFHANSGGASRFFYVAKASKRERNAGLEGMPLVESGIKNDSGRGFSESDPHKKIYNQNHHPTVKPIKLMEYLIKLITPPGGTVLDPFMGSGSTGVAAFKNGFKFIGIEMNEEYCEIARRRIDSSRSS